ncbi:energy transducer TonB [Novosphingobium flavum]|uniref:Energy transducer TonB n=1 Tax=Novosphingobium flavum TaxID=1778672 RepID=A0A7X1FTV6_9SPHN|nr:TonB family protein [Novosphingobium flavum]MBC2666873.1 energy transducer TonB [Novosphingobium flavum]
MFKTKTSIVLLSIAASLLGTSPALAQAAGWTQQVARIVASKQTYPRTAQMRGEEGTAKVKIYVNAGGAIERAELVAASGSATLDKEALSLPTKVGALPAPPGGATSVTLPITWRLN